eukprot:20314-Heterococcus_DN1.PRE.5
MAAFSATRPTSWLDSASTGSTCRSSSSSEEQGQCTERLKLAIAPSHQQCTATADSCIAAASHADRLASALYERHAHYTSSLIAGAR